MSALDLFSRSAVSKPSRMSGFINGLSLRVQRYRTYRQTLEELENLSERELADLGVSPLQLRSIAYRAAYDS